jgi:hypothetical protein
MKKVISLVFALVLIFALGMAVSAETAPVGELPAASTQGEALIEEESALEEEHPAEPARSRSGNTPLFIGAGIAALLFIGVALYCRANGNKTL